MCGRAGERDGRWADAWAPFRGTDTSHERSEEGRERGRVVCEVPQGEREKNNNSYLENRLSYRIAVNGKRLVILSCIRWRSGRQCIIREKKRGCRRGGTEDRNNFLSSIKWKNAFRTTEKVSCALTLRRLVSALWILQKTFVNKRFSPRPLHVDEPGGHHPLANAYSQRKGHERGGRQTSRFGAIVFGIGICL